LGIPSAIHFSNWAKSQVLNGAAGGIGELLILLIAGSNPELETAETTSECDVRAIPPEGLFAE
jgi:hypothetical protein